MHRYHEMSVVPLVGIKKPYYKEPVMHRYHEIAVLIAFTAGAACNDIAPDGTGLVIETLAEQPHSAELGVSLAIHARGGGSIYVSVEEGVFLATAAGPGQVPAAQ